MPINARQVIRIPIQPFFVGKATIASLWKCGFMGDTFVRGRAPFEKFQRSFIGDLAKLALKFWLESRGFEVTDWDDVRTSWRSSRKQFDLEVLGHSIEVRSSIAAYQNTGEILRNEHIIHPCNVRLKEITVQVFFLNNTCHEALLSGWARADNLESDNYREVRRVGPRLVDFYMMGFDDANASSMSDLVGFLQSGLHTS